MICHYYHAAGPPLAVGTVLAAQLNPLPPAFADLLDRFRPDGGPRRRAALYLRMEPDSLFGHGLANLNRIYRVAPVGPERRVDDTWLDGVSDLVLNATTQRSRNLEWLASYWQGERSPRWRGWTVLCPFFVVTGPLAPVDAARAALIPPPPLEVDLVPITVVEHPGPTVTTTLGPTIAKLTRRALAEARLVS